MYEHLVYDDFVFTTPAQVEPRLYERTLTINGVSKAYCMTGWRIGFAGGPEPLIKAMAMIQSQSTIQSGGGVAMGGGRGAQRTEGFHRRSTTGFSRNAATSASPCSTRRRASHCPKPEGAFYVYPSCAGTIGKIAPSGNKIGTDEEFVTEFLEAEGVAVVQGTPFGLGPAFRISYATATPRFRTACERIQRFCANLR